jgi:LacI family transcriptional regulator
MLKSITIHDIDRSLKISTSTVSRALNESSRISAKTITLVKKKAKEL